MGAYLCIAANSVPPTVSKRIKVSVDCEYIFFLEKLLFKKKKNRAGQIHAIFLFYFYIIAILKGNEHDEG